MPQTLLLDTVSWDLVLDVHGNIAIASEPYSLAQDAASACRTFLGEVYYDTTLGIPYFSEVLGLTPPPNLLKTLLVNAALTVPGVTSAKVFLTSIKNREIGGQVQITSTTGAVAAANLGFAAVNPDAGKFILNFSSLGGPDVLT